LSEGGVQAFLNAIIDIVANSPPDKVSQLASAVRRIQSAAEGGLLEGWAANPAAQARLSTLVRAWKATGVPPGELAGLLIGAAAAYNQARGEQEIELVWTGPSSKLIATRKTEQALLQVIDAAETRLFMTSFVAYDVPSVMAALMRASERGLNVSMLLEASDKHGGTVSIDAIGKMKAALPAARIYSWSEKDGSFAGGKVHAKVAVADERFCFVARI
jgi:cardiolipin synthase